MTWLRQNRTAIAPSDDHEHCNDCGNAYADVYWLDDELWELLHERAPGGLLCPSCAVRRALNLSNHVVDEWQDERGVKL